MSPSDTIATPIYGSGLKVAYTGTAGTTTAFPASTNAVRVIATTDCFVRIGASPTAVADVDVYLPAYVAEYFTCPPNGKVSAVQVAAAGTIYAIPI